MRAGSLRHRLTLQKPTKTQNDYGEVETSYTDHDTVWASISPLKGREYFESQQIQAEVTAEIHIRYRSDVRPDWRAKLGNRTYRIEAVIDEDMRHRILRLMCSEVVT